MSLTEFDDLKIDDLRRRRGKKWHTYGAQILPAWVADMDFPPAPAIRRRLQEALDTSDLGYPHDRHIDHVIELFVERCRQHFGWTVPAGRVELITDVVQGIQIGLQLFSKADQGAAILTPIYPPFLNATRAMGRRADCCTLTGDDAGWSVDWDRLEASIRPDTRVLLLCNPHNPTGRVFSHSELTRFAELALRRDLVVVSDEVHSDLVFPGHRHIPFASLGPEIAARTVTLMSATKSFNIAGLRCAMMVFGSPSHQAWYRSSPQFTGGAASSLGLHAAEIAWRECDDWLAALMRYLDGNRVLIRDFLGAHLPSVRFRPPEATYLAWLDCRQLALGEDLWRTILEHGQLALSDGREFGDGGAERVRLNFATSSAILEEALERLHRALTR